MTSAEIRQSFLGFFREKKHTIAPSSSLLPDAPNLLFTNAGMNQFVPIFLGQTKCPYRPARAADTQKCIRAGGKHNDLEDVGLDTYHHTFFEMLGNWSFGDYFKREAIDWAWELLVQRWHFPKERLYATYFGGDDKTPADDEVRDLWLRYLPADHVVAGSRKDNFWMMGDTGPCGPCSEIHIDLTARGDGGAKLVNAGTAQCIEIWNLVFIQFNANPDGSLTPLSAKHVDTGMGFERVCSIIQCTDNLKDFSGRISNYETDVFSPIFRELEKLSGRKYASTLPQVSGSAVVSTASVGVPPTESAARDAQQGDRDGRAPQATYSKRRLPHFERPWAKYAVSFSTRERRQLSPQARDVVLKSLLFGHEQRRYQLYAACVMPDHVHFLFEPQIKEQDKEGKPVFWSITELLHSIKSFTAHEINKVEKRTGQVWENESFDRMIRGDADLEEKFYYICRNPWDSGVVPPTENYSWLWTPDMKTEALGSAVVSTASVGVPPTESAARDAQQGDRDGRAPHSFDQIQIDIAFRVIADHVRCLSFAIADGILPSNEGRGYVLRRILRRAIRYGRDLGFHEPFFCKFVDVVADNFGSVFPELRERKQAISNTLRAEEENFNKTLDRGIEVFEKVCVFSTGKVFSADEAFRLYDTYGFPLDLTELMARERGMTVDVNGFEKLMEEQRQRAREDHDKKRSVITVATGNLQVEPTKFLGYDNLEAEAVVEAASPGAENAFDVVLDQTPFYAEMGGQVGDTGLVHVPGHDRTEIGKLQVLDTQKQGDVHVHHAKLAEGRAPEVGEAVRVAVDAARRANIQRHHTVTHLFHWALHEVVSKDARQRGSLVAPDRLRFDFNHPERLSEQQIVEIERLVNERIKESARVYWFEMSYAEVRGKPNIMQFFGDKYGDVVRIVQIGGHDKALDGFSMELCGGTHTKTTGEIGLFKIMRESAIAAGVRRVEAACGQFAQEFIEKQRGQERAEAEKSKARAMEKELAKQRQAAMQSQAPAIAQQLLAKLQGNLLVSNLGDASAELLRAVVDALKPEVASAVVVLGGVAEGRVSLICYVTADLVKQGKHAGRIVGELARICGGGGGGRPDLAQAGGKQPEKLSEALAAVSRIAGS